MFKSSLVMVLLVSVFQISAAHANCQKTLMGNDCEGSAKGVSSHMRGNAVANAKASKELKAAQQKAKKQAKALALKK